MVPEGAPAVTKLDTEVNGGRSTVPMCCSAPRTLTPGTARESGPNIPGPALAPWARPRRVAAQPGPDERTKDVRRNYLAFTELTRARRTMKVPPTKWAQNEKGPTKCTPVQ